MPGILIVDDNPSIRCLLRVFVEAQTPFKVCGEAGHGVQAIEMAKLLQPDLILLDLSMPVLGGVEAASIIKKNLPNIKIVLFSMHVEDIPKALAARIGVDLTLSKMDGIARLNEHISRLLRPTPPTGEPSLQTQEVKNAPLPI